ncbi:MAG: glycoside hydrolase family 99-like domain-containing protein [Phormidium sp.]
MADQNQVKLIAFYLPQYHPIPENDQWWGKGFTEWTNVTKAKPLFPGHYQPHLPADLGFYDLRLPEAREAQAELARAYGIYGFCYYHYWFNGKRLLERPFNEVLASGKPDFPFCLCWANENWTRVWDGQNKHILMEQKYGEEDDREHIRSLIKAFKDPRYIKIDGKPIFLIYRSSNLPNPLQTTSIWREEARKMGIEDLFLCRVESFNDENKSLVKQGFDAAIEFQPQWKPLLNKTKMWRLGRKLRIWDKVYRENFIFDYAATVEKMLQKPIPSHKYFHCVTPIWDNSARRKDNALILKNSSPDVYEYWLKKVIEQGAARNPEENLVFINAWNEWGEGNHLEPCQKWGRAYLEATLRAVNSTSKSQTISPEIVEGR